MNLKLCLSLLLFLSGSLCCCLPGEAARAAPVLQASKVQQLIAQLGDDEFLLRQRAEAQLLELGAAAFAELQTAERHADLEVSTRARYILNQISIEWLRPTDPPAVQSIMSRYGEIAIPVKLAKIRELAKLPDEQGFGALGRIARYDTSSGLVSRYAALAAIEKGLLPAARAPKAIALLREELGDSSAAASTWVATYAAQLQFPERVHPGWLDLIDQEIELLTEAPERTDDSLTLALIGAHLDLSDQLDDDQAILAGLERRIVLANANQSDADSDVSTIAGLVEAVAWLVDREQWGALSLLENRYVLTIKQSRTLLYRIALARKQQGRPDAAQTLAEKAFAVAEQSIEERNECADYVADRGDHDWAEREWYAVVEATQATDFQSLIARNSLGIYCLNDRLQHQAAADLLTEAIDAIDADADVSQEYAEKNQLRYLKLVRANRDFFLAYQVAAEGDFQAERKYLEQAFAFEPDNADILIAMFQSREADEEYRKQASTRLLTARKKLEKEIIQLKRVKRRTALLNRELAIRYNHWAWLVSNTEGDFKKAVAYSKLSLKMQPGSASYLDTLGRCYYAAGNLEEALKVQQEAVEKHPHLMVMQRQLQLIQETQASSE